MNEVLKNKIQPSKKSSGKYPYDFKSPSYDNRTSSSVSAGNDYGIGFRQPVGKEKASSVDSGPLSVKSHCFSPKEIFNGEDVSG